MAGFFRESIYLTTNVVWVDILPLFFEGGGGHGGHAHTEARYKFSKFKLQGLDFQEEKLTEVMRKKSTIEISRMRTKCSREKRPSSFLK